jgi:hypothetical protein
LKPKFAFFSVSSPRVDLPRRGWGPCKTAYIAGGSLRSTGGWFMNFPALSPIGRKIRQGGAATAAGRLGRLKF